MQKLKKTQKEDPEITNEGVSKRRLKLLLEQLSLRIFDSNFGSGTRVEIAKSILSSYDVSLESCPRAALFLVCLKITLFCFPSSSSKAPHLANLNESFFGC